ncbi:WD domain, G-beta repeat protein, partial [Opisthorchis viverrini]
MDFKRPLAGVATMSMVPLPTKRARYDTPSALLPFGGNNRTGTQIISAGKPGSIPRTSNLLSPNMLLNGHDSEIYCGKFSSDGTFLVSAGFDRRILIWETYGECENISVMTGTSIADTPLYTVLAVTFSDTAEIIFSGGIDNVVKGWDLRKLDASMLLTGHTDTVTGLSVSPDGSYLLSNAMDNTLRMWDVRPFAPAERCSKRGSRITLYIMLQGTLSSILNFAISQVFIGHQHTFEKNLLRCAWSADGRRITCGSGDRYVHVWDTNTRQLIYKLPGHTASVNETALHPTEPILLSVGSDKKIFLDSEEELDLSRLVDGLTDSRLGEVMGGESKGGSLRNASSSWNVYHRNELRSITDAAIPEADCKAWLGGTQSLHCLPNSLQDLRSRRVGVPNRSDVKQKATICIMEGEGRISRPSTQIHNSLLMFNRGLPLEAFPALDPDMLLPVTVDADETLGAPDPLGPVAETAVLDGLELELSSGIKYRSIKPKRSSQDSVPHTSARSANSNCDKAR